MATENLRDVNSSPIYKQSQASIGDWLAWPALAKHWHCDVPTGIAAKPHASFNEKSARVG